MDLSRKLERLDKARSLLASFSASQAAVKIAPAGPAPVVPSSILPPLHPPPLPARMRFEIIENTLEPHHCHGKIPIARARLQPPQLLAALALDPELADVDLSRALFLDTETTGLSGGTGTLAFLIGLARFLDDSLHLEQLFLREPGQERPMLEILRTRVAEASCLVTFNGKSFDWPLLNTRLVMARLSPPPLPPHLDLLHCARRVYKRRLREVRLVRLEEEILGMRRDRDVTGQEIPGLYWSFVRTGRDSVITPVIEHNANDLVAMAAMMVRLCEKFAAVCREDDPLDHYSMALIARRAGDEDKAMAFAAAAARGGGGDTLTAEALQLIARLELSRGRHLEAIAALEEALLLAPAADTKLIIHLKLAKIFEHRAKDPVRALQHAAFTETVEGLERHQRRWARLHHKQEKMQRSAP